VLDQGLRQGESTPQKASRALSHRLPIKRRGGLDQAFFLARPRNPASRELSVLLLPQLLVINKDFPWLARGYLFPILKFQVWPGGNIKSAFLSCLAG
jgi:hypothetical protein